MAKGDISVGFGGMGPSDVRASGIPSMADSVTVPADDTSASWLDRLLESVAGPKMTEDPNYGPDSTMAQLYDKYARPMNPLNLLVGAAKEVPALAAKVPLNAARFASRFSPDPNAEQYLSGDDPESIGAKIDALTTTGALGSRDFGQSVGAAGTDIMAMVAGDEALALPALSEALPSALTKLPGLSTAVDWAGTNIGKGGLYGQLLDNDAETGAVYGGIGGAAVGSGEAILSRAAPFLESAAEKSLGRVIAPGKEAWKKFVGRNAQDIIRDVPLSAAAPWREGGGLQGIVDYAQQQADNIGVSLDAAYAQRLQPDIAPKLKGIRDQIRSTADNLLQAHGMAVVNLAPESKQALEEIRASLATGRGALNPKDTNISVLQDAASRLQDVVSGLGPEMQRVGMASPLSFQGQTIQRGIARGAQSTAEQGIARAMGDIDNVINTDLVGTRMATEPLARRIDKLRMNFGDMNAAGEFVSTDPAFSNSIEKLAATVRSYGPEMNAQQLRNLAQDWGKIVSGANGRGFLSPMADESMKGAMRAARGEVETTRDALMGDTVRDQSNEFAFWKRLSEAAESTAERRVGHTGGGLFGAMATLAGVGGGEYAAHAAGHGVAGALGLGAGGAAAAAVTVRVMRSPIYNLLSAKTKLAMASALRKGTNAALGTAMRRALLELSLLNHGGLSALGHTDLTATEADAEHHNILNGRGVTPGVLESANPDTVYGAGGSVDPGIEHNQRLLQQQDQIDQSIEEAAPLDPQTESRVYDKLANTQVASAGLSRLPEWLQTQLINAPDLGPTHPHLQKLANLIAEQTSPLNVAFLGEEALRPLAAGTRLVKPVEMIGKGLSAAMAAAGLQTGLEGVQEGRPGKVISGGVQTGLGALGLRGGGVARAAGEAGEAVGAFGTRLGQGLANAGKQALIGPAIGLSSQALANTDLAKSLIPDDEMRQAVFEAAGVGAGVTGLGMAARRGMREIPGVGEVTVKKGPDFAMDGAWHVTLPDGRTYSIFKDSGGSPLPWHVHGLLDHPINAETMPEMIQQLQTLDESRPVLNKYTGRRENQTIKQALDKERSAAGLYATDDLQAPGALGDTTAPMKLSATSGFKGNVGTEEPVVPTRSAKKDRVPAKGENYPPSFDFESQVGQYPATGEPGVSYFKGDLGAKNSKGEPMHADTLLYRDDNGKVIGILNHYPMDITTRAQGGVYRGMTMLIEKAGNVNLMVDPGEQQRGVGSALLKDAIKRWDVDLSKQDYTQEGRAFARRFTTKQKVQGAKDAFADLLRGRVGREPSDTSMDKSPEVGPAGEGSALESAAPTVQNRVQGMPTTASLVKTLKKGGGFTVDTKTGVVPDTGTMVGLYPNGDKRVLVVPVRRLTTQLVDDYLTKMAPQLAGKERYLGGWVSGKNAYLDVPLRVVKEEPQRVSKSGKPIIESVAQRAGRIEKQERAAIARAGGTTQWEPDAGVRERGRQIATWTNDAPEIRPDIAAFRRANGGRAPSAKELETIKKVAWDRAFQTGANERMVGDPRGFLESPTFERRAIEQADAGLRFLQEKGVTNPEWWKLRGTIWERLYADRPDGTMTDARMKRVAGFLAATAPNAGTTDNVRQATEYLRRMLKKEPIIQPDWRAIPGVNVTHMEAGKMMPMETVRANNLELAMRKRGDLMNEDKVREEFKALTGDPNAQVLDTQLAKIGEVPESGVYLNATAGRIEGKAYPVMANRLREIAVKLGRVPRDFTAEVWTGIRETIRKTGELYGRKHKRPVGESYGYDQILEREVAFTAKKLGITPSEVERRIRAGHMSTLAALLATGATAHAAAQQWLAAQQSDEAPDDAGQSTSDAHIGG